MRLKISNTKEAILMSEWQWQHIFLISLSHTIDFTLDKFRDLDFDDNWVSVTTVFT